MLARIKYYCLNFSSSFSSQHCTNDLIIGLCKQGRYHEALEAAFSSDCVFYPSTYAQLFQASSSVRSLSAIRRLHHRLSTSPVNADVILHNHTLNAYGKCRSLDDALQLFDTMPERNLVSWTSVISGLSQNHREREAIELYLRMLRSGFLPDQFALGSAVRACSGLLDIELGRQLHCHTIKMDHGQDRIVQNALVTMYSRSDSIRDASVVFERIADKDLVSWGSMIAALSQKRHELEALCLFKQMLDIGVDRPNEFHFGSLFSACGVTSRLDQGEQLHGLSVKFGLETDNFAGCSLSDMYARCGRLNHARKAFSQIESPDLVSWNSIISAFAYAGFLNEALLFFSQMRGFGLQPDDITIRCLLCPCTSTSLHQGQLVHCYALKMGLCRNIAVLNSLLAMYTTCSDLYTSFDLLFKDINHDHDIVSWNTILTACLQHHQPEKVFFLLKELQNSSNKPDQITLNAILCACADLAYLNMGNQINAYAIKLGLNTDVMVCNGLIDTYAKCGSLDKARKLFELMGDNHDVFSWSSLIVGYAQFGFGRESLELFTLMQNLGIKPNHVTFVGVLTACKHIGLVDEGLHYYKQMEAEHHIAPTREHCSCIIDLLARSGRLTEAERFKDEMPFEADIVMLKTLLAACRVYNNVEIGKRAAQGILKMDPFNSAAYVLMCNIYASAGCWDDFARWRKAMKSNGVIKSPGRSWIEVKGEVRVFTVEDTSDSESDEIYMLLDVLQMEMLEAGYSPMPLSWHE
ncbi:putative tetratricopeptide-like helical domain superfamily [Dioscorea sansibarensis]